MNAVSQSLVIWRSSIQAYSDIVASAMVGSLRAERRDVCSYLSKLLRAKEFRSFCNELHPRYFDVIRRFVEGVSPDILVRELFGASGIPGDVKLTPDSSLQAISKLYTQYLSAQLLAQDPFCVDELSFREALKVASAISTSHRYIDQPALLNALEAVEQDSALLFKTKYKNFNYILGGGLRTRRLYTIGGAPGVGKSGMLLNFFIDGCLNEVPSTYITIENSIEETQRRIISYLTQYDLSMLYFDRPGVREEVLMRLDSVKHLTDKINTYGKILETPSITLDEIRNRMQENETKLLVLDYLNLVTHSVWRDTSKDLEDLTINLARSSKEFDNAIITACQLNRGAIQAAEPDESHVGESFGIVKASDMFCTLYPHRSTEATSEVSETSSSKTSMMTFQIAKSRFTGLGKIPLACQKGTVQFNEL